MTLNSLLINSCYSWVDHSLPTLSHYLIHDHLLVGFSQRTWGPFTNQVVIFLELKWEGGLRLKSLVLARTQRVVLVEIEFSRRP